MAPTLKALSTTLLLGTLLIAPTLTCAQPALAALPLPAVPFEPQPSGTGVAGQSQGPDESDTWKPRLTAPGKAKYEEVSHWYGYEILAIDGAAILVTVLGIAADSSVLAVMGAAGYTFGPPILHGVHGSGGRAIGSLALRIGLPNILGIVGYAIAYEMQNCSKKDEDSWDLFPCGFEGLIIGTVVGFPVAIAIDAAALSWETIRRPAVVEPVVSVRDDEVVLGAVFRPAL